MRSFDVMLTGQPLVIATAFIKTCSGKYFSYMAWVSNNI